MTTVFFDIDTQVDFLYPAGALYVPGARPVVFHVTVEMVLYACRMVHAPPGAWTQNSYRGLGQPLAVALNVTEVPGFCGEAGLGPFHVTAVHAGPACSV